MSEEWVSNPYNVENGKIVYTPTPVYGLSLDGSHHFELDHADMNVANGDFLLDVVVLIETGSPSTVTLIGKPPSSWSGNAGYRFFADTTNKRLGLTINDGDASETTVYSPNNSFSLDSHRWFAVRADRDGNATFFVNGVPVGTGDISGCSGSLDNSEPLVIGEDLEGIITHARIRHSVLADQWFLPEYYRLAYGYPKTIQDFTAFWTFPQSLVDLSGAYTLTLQGTGEATYVTGWPSVNAPLTCNLDMMFEFPFDTGFIDADANTRTISGALKSYKGCRKRRWSVTFPYLPPPQCIALESIYASGMAFDFYHDAGLPRDCRAMMVSAPAATAELYDAWSMEVEIEEV